MNKLLVRLGVAGVLTAGAVWAVKNRDRIARTATRGAHKAKELGDRSVARAVTLIDQAADKLATGWLPQATPEAQKPTEDEYTHAEPLLDDER